MVNFLNRSESHPLATNTGAFSKERRVTSYSYDRSKLRPGIVHIGVGNFVRAHLAMYVDRCLHLPDQESWGIAGVGLGDGPDKRQKAESIKRQSSVYSLTEYAPDGGVSVTVIGSMIEFLHGPTAPAAVLDRLASPETKIVSLTITEGGYNIDEATREFVIQNPDVQHDLANPTSPKTAFGFIVEALARRRTAGLSGFALMSCDNLRSNGSVTRKAVIGFAKARDEKLADWISAHCSFPNSMVDRIAPSVGATEKAKANAFSGLDDETPVIGESFTQWVLEDDFIAGRPAFDKVGVELRDDVAAFETIKGRLLNASHMMMSYPALMAGHRIVDHALRDASVRNFLLAFMDKDVIPLVQPPRGVSLIAYKNQIIERFENPAVGDQLLRIAQNGTAKLPIFLSKTLGELLQRGGAFERIALNLAAFEQYLRGSDLAGDRFVVDEPNLTESDRALLVSEDQQAVLKLSPFAPLRLVDDERFRAVFDSARERLRQQGARAAMDHAAFPEAH
ncbi:mannitol dehydrogenase family protein [Rhizobium leguminosarum]|uniref:mannitol dehydrogenase family protein n=1 Tax=Rhizobium leguminosarum TaxID=384 RepID=UPI001C987136|nr:mannitol dehydrogenase family protein [Rhizobium leguminosarum]MBY5406450.1 mannitol dehydrogenase family protein [Rhizobium leguminosarum]